MSQTRRSEELHCEECGKPLGQLPPTAPHKRFCSRECRLAWHADEMKKARQLLAESKEKEQGQ